MDTYSILLLSAMAAAGAGAMGWILAYRPARWFGGGIATFLGLATLVFHWRTGHARDTPEPMGLAALIENHPAPVTVAAIGVLLLTVRTRRKV